MTLLPQEVLEAWEQKEGPVVLTTVGNDCLPNSVYATCTRLSDDGRIVVADNYFSKTYENISHGSPGAVLFITPKGKSYQVKGDIAYYTEGELFDFMKSWNPKEHPGKGVVVINTREVYSGKAQIL